MPVATRTTPTKAQQIAMTFAESRHPPARSISFGREIAVAWDAPVEGRPATGVAFTERHNVRLELVLDKRADALSPEDISAIPLAPHPRWRAETPTVFATLASWGNFGGIPQVIVSRQLPALLRSLASPSADAVAAMRRCGRYDENTWLWLSCPRQGARNRAFSACHPWLAECAAHAIVTDLIEPAADLPHEALAYEALRPSLMFPKVWRSGDTHLAIEALRGFVLPSGPIHLDDPYLAGVAQMPRETWPSHTDAESRQPDLAAFYVLSRLAVACSLATGRPVASILGPMQGWAEYAALLHARSGLAERYAEQPHDRVWDDASRPLDAIRDMVEAFSEQVVEPASRLSGIAGEEPGKLSRVEVLGLLHLSSGRPGLVKDGHRAGALRLLLGERTLPRLAEVAARWHSRTSAIQRAVVALPDAPDLQGPLVFDETELPGGIVARCLVNAGDLLDEGAPVLDTDGVAGLDHCVASYMPRVVDGKTTIVSFRRGRLGPRLSTAEVQFSGGAFRVVQHRGRGNSEPPAVATEALRSLLPRVAADASAVLASWKIPSAQDRTTINSLGSWETIARLWDFALPRPLRGLDASSLAAAGGLVGKGRN